MVDAIILDQQDKILLRKGSNGDYDVREITIHAKNPEELIKQTNEVIKKLKEGKVFHISEPRPPDSDYICSTCGKKLDTYQEQPELVKLKCESEACKGLVRLFRRVKKTENGGKSHV